MRVLASLSTAAATAVVLASCGLEMGGLEDVGTAEGGPTLDGTAAGEGGSSGASSGGSSGGSSGSSSGGVDGSSDGTTGPEGSSSGAVDSTAPPMDAAMDTGSKLDSSVPETGVVDTGTVETGPPPCTTANNCYVIPANWQLVAVTSGASAPSAPCPSGFAATAPSDLDEGPNTSAACACGTCAMGSTPTCPSGPIQDFFDVQNLPGAGQCGTAGTPAASKNASACNTDLYNGPAPISYANMDLKYVPPAATGGNCTSAGTTTGNVTYASYARACMPDSQASAGCVGNQCTLTLAAPYAVCIAQAGPQTCPGAPFTHQHLVGGPASLTCSSCGCNVTATCTGTMKLFTSNDCTTNGGAKEDDVVADGACHDSNTSQGSFNSYSYTVNPPSAVACHATGTSTAQNVALGNEETLCCTQ